MIHGAARGADTLAGRWAQDRNIPVREFPAEWRVNGRYNNHAGLDRNARMLRHGKPDLVAAFPGGTGTAHMVSIAARADVPVRKFSPDTGNNGAPGNYSSRPTRKPDSPPPAKASHPATAPSPERRFHTPTGPRRPAFGTAMPRPDASANPGRRNSTRLGGG